MPRAMLAGDGTDYRSRLVDGGLFIAPGQKARELLTAYLASSRTPARARAVLRVGLVGALLFRTLHGQDSFRRTVSGPV